MTNRALRFIFAADLFLAAFFLAGCGTPMPQGIQQARTAAAQSIQAEPPGDYFIGRRYFKIRSSSSGVTCESLVSPGAPRSWSCSTRRKSWRPIVSS